jgi:CRISPR-associated RAMP protein (TIGR02581 family)
MMLRKWLCQVDITLRLHPIDPILIKSGYATLQGPDMVPVETFRDGKATFYFPGTSLKGVLRSHFERIARTLQPGSVCVPYYNPKRKHQINIPVPQEQESYGCGFREPGEGRPETSATAYYESCAACRLFGSLRFAGRFSIGDAYPLPEPAPQPKPGQRNGVGIDRFTGGTVRGVLFDLVVVEGGVFETSIRVTNFELWQLAAVNFLLQDLQEEMITLGSGRSRGLGRVRGEVVRYLLRYIRPQRNVVGLAELATEQERQAYRLFTWHPPEPIPLPTGQIQGLRHEYNLTANWSDLLQPLAESLEAFLHWHQPLGAVNHNSREARRED